MANAGKDTNGSQVIFDVLVLPFFVFPDEEIAAYLECPLSREYIAVLPLYGGNPLVGR